MNCTCGYEHSYNSNELDSTRFISRYRGSNDYCVNGRRIGLDDNGTWHREPTEIEKQLITAYRAKFE